MRSIMGKAGKQTLPRAQGVRTRCNAGSEIGCFNWIDAENGTGGRVHARSDFSTTRAPKAIPACGSLGNAYRRGIVVPVDQERGRSLLAFACERENHWSCGQLGYAYWEGDGQTTDLKRARELLESACNHKGGEFCLDLARLAESESSLAISPTVWVPWMLKACDDGIGEACFLAGHRIHKLHDTNSNTPRALFERACKLENASGCIEFANTLSTGSDAEKSSALTIYREQCRNDVPVGCNNVGWALESGTGTKPDLAEARTFYQKACNLDFADSCSAMGIRTILDDQDDKKTDRAEAYYTKACGLGSDTGCSEIAGADG
jgi:hypothetical protein